MVRPYGFHPAAFKAYILACYRAGVDPDRVSQTIGNAKASAGYHARDGVMMDGVIPRAYCAATDIGVRGLSDEKIKTLLERLAEVGFFGWYRHTGSFANNRHIHFVWAACKMKPQLRGQFHDWVHNRNGLVGHGWEEFFTPTQAMDDYLRTQFFKYNPQTD